jgi:hypothetical protein
MYRIILLDKIIDEKRLANVRRSNSSKDVYAEVMEEEVQ